MQEVSRFVFHLVIANKRRDCVLGEVLPNGVLRLPTAKMPAGFSFPEPNGEGDVETYIEAQLGIYGYLARLLGNGMNNRIRVADVLEQHEIFLMDLLDKDSVVRKPLEWIRHDVACKSKWEQTNGDGKEGYVNCVLERVFDRINDEARIKRVDGWKTLGWFEKLMLWTRDTLEARNMVMVGRLRQRYSSTLSLVADCKVKKRETHVGRQEQVQEHGCSELIFVKAAIPVTREARRTATIGAVLGNIVPEVIAVHDREGLMIQRNGGMVTDEVFDQEALINTILKMQELSMNRISELEAGGLKILDSEWLESNIESILKHKIFEDYQIDEDGEVDKKREETVNVLISLEDSIKKGCRKVTSLGLPRTVVHGDLNLGHVGSPLKGETKLYRMFDWGNSFIGNPLHDFGTLFADSMSDFPELSLDFDAGVKQMCRRWLPGVTVAEVKLMFELVSMMSGIFRLYSLTQEYDAYDDPSIAGRARVLGLLDEMIYFAIDFEFT